MSTSGPEVERVVSMPGGDLPSSFPSSAEWPAVAPLHGAHDPSSSLALHLAQSPLPIVECDFAMRVTRWSAEAETLFGWPAGEVLGRSLDDIRLVHDDDVPHVRQLVAAMHEGASPRNVSRHRNRTRDGRVVFCEWYNSALRDEQGTLVSLLSIVVDVTARVEAERRLRDALAREATTLELLRERDEAIEQQFAELEAVYRDLPVGLCLLDTDGRFVRINERLAEMNGIPIEDHPGRRVHDVLPEIGPFAETMLRRVLERGQPIHDVELEGETPADPGVTHTWREHWRPIRDATDRIVAVSVIVEDVTAQKLAARERERLLADERSARARAERRLEHARRLQAVTAALSRALTPSEVATAVLTEGTAAIGSTTGSLGLIAEDGDTVMTVANIGWRERGLWQSYSLSQSGSAGYEAAQRRDLVHIESPAAYRARYPRVADAIAEAGLAASTVVPLVFGGRVQGLLGFSWERPRELEDDERLLLLSVAGQCAQALERARLFEAEQRSRAEAEQANRAKGDFLAVMSHELRTPLNAISGYVQLLEMGIRGPVSEPMKQDLSRIGAAGQHLLGLINSVLHFAKLEAGHVQFAIEAVPVAELLSSVAVIVAPLAAAKGLRFEVGHPAPGLHARADREKAMQVLVNLAGNAVKFTERGMVSITACESEHGVAIRVRDTGPGIAAERLTGIFDPFVQFDTRPGHAGEGIGLGLAISRDLARGMGGEIRVRSEVGSGSEFVVELERG